MRAQAIGLDVLQTLIGLFVVIPAVLGPQHVGAVRRVLRSRTMVFLGVISLRHVPLALVRIADRAE
jgi:hypothetical protein